MKLVEKIDVTKPVEPKWIRADSLWNEIANSSFFSTKEKEKIRFLLENEPGGCISNWDDFRFLKVRPVFFIMPPYYAVKLNKEKGNNNDVFKKEVQSYKA